MFFHIEQWILLNLGAMKNQLMSGGVRASAMDRESNLAGFVHDQLLPWFSAQGESSDQQLGQQGL
jgi:hypothetical protein